MKTTRKILLTGLGLLILIAIWLFMDRALAQRSVAQFRTELAAKHDRPPIEVSGDADVSFLSTHSSVDLSALWEHFADVPQLMRMLPSGNARVTWQTEYLHSGFSTNAWPTIHARVSELDTEIQLLVDAVDDKSGMSQTDRDGVIHNGQMAKVWLGVAMSAHLQSDNPDDALLYLEAMLKHGNTTNSNWMWAENDLGAFGATWEFLQSTNLSDAHLQNLAHVVSKHRGPAMWDDRFHAFGMVLATSFQMMRADPSAPMFARPTGSTHLASWSDFVSALMNDPASAWAWLKAKPAKWKYYWRDTYLDEQWSLVELGIDWDAAKIGLAAGAMTNGIQWAREQRGLHGPPAKGLWGSHSMLSMATAGTTTLPDHAHILTKLAAEEIRYRLMATAIALHRFRLRENEFPESLGKLVPAFLPAVPLDLMDGQPLRYERLVNGTFKLYSIGCYDGDNSGNGAHKYSHAISGEPFFGLVTDWPERLDWIWPVPATQAEVDADNAAIGTARNSVVRHTTVVAP